MNVLNQAQSALGGLSGGNQQNQAQQQQQQGQQQNPQNPGQDAGAAVQTGTGQVPNATASTGQQDALDKGIDGFLKKAGHGQSVGTTEKISDGVRSAFKSATGKDVPIKDLQ